MEGITCELNGKKYLLVEIPFRRQDFKKVSERMKKYNHIPQGIKVLQKETFWSDGRYALRCLIWEKDIEEWKTEKI